MRIGRRNIVTRGTVVAILGFALAACPTSAPGQARAPLKVYTDSSHTADTLLRNGDNMARSGQFAAALDIYQRVIAQFGDKVVEVPNDQPAADPLDETHLFVSARFDCQRRIAALPPEGRALYRGRVDGQAKRWYEAGLAARDLELLRRVVEETFCSSWGDEALELLGDLAFQEGRFAEALADYRRLSPEPGAPYAGLAHPDPSVDLARISAKALLAKAGLGPAPPTKSELEAFAKRFPNAKGALAGRDEGTYAEIVADALSKDGLAPITTSDLRWPTFAGSPTRNRIASGSLDVGSMQWQIDLEPSQGPTQRPSQFRGGFGRGMQYDTLTPPPPERRLAYHPIIVGEQVVLCNSREILAFDLAQRPVSNPSMPPAAPRPAWRQESQEGINSANNRRYQTVARYTMTAYRDRIYARMGPSPVLSSSNWGGRNNGAPQTFSESMVVALDRNADGKFLWRKYPADVVLPDRKAESDPRTLVFDGSPVVDDSGVYIAMTDRVEMTRAYVVCLDPDDGSTKWVRYVCEAQGNVDRMSGSSATELSYRLLTLDGSSIYFQTNLGALAALDSRNGAIRWISTYPWEGKAATTQERDLNPAVVADGLVVIAPDDAPAIFAYDAMGGRLVWKTKNFPDEVKLTHLLGVAKGRVVATGNRVYLFDAKNGELAKIWPDGVQPPDAFGRGVLAGDKIYWPTKNEIHVLDQASGLRTEPPIKLQQRFGVTGGNLAVGDGYLLVASEDKLVVFCQNSRLIERFREEIVKAPDQAQNYYRLALAAESSGLNALAMEHLDLTLRKAKPNEIVDGLPLVEAVRDHQHRIHMQQGYAAKEKEDWALAESQFAGAGSIARTPRDRLAATLELAECRAGAKKYKESVKTLQSVLADPDLRSLVIQVADGRRSVRVDLLVVDRLADLLKKHGRSAYEEFDREADVAAAKYKADNDPRLLENLTRLMPLARSVPDSLLAVGGLYERQGRFAEATRAYKRLEALADSPEFEARALIGQGRCYEAANLPLPARGAYLAAKAKHPEARIDDARLGDWVDRRLASKAFERLGGAAEATVDAPLLRRRVLTWDIKVRPIATEGFPPSNEAGRLYLVDGTKIAPVEPGRDRPSWSRDLKIEPVWIGYLADKIIVGARNKICALAINTGEPLWEFDGGRASEGRGPASVFEQTEEEGSEVLPTGLHEFRILDGRILCLRGDQAILSLDGESGQVEWTFTPLMGRINHNWLVSGSKIVFQVVSPGSMVVLDAANGRKLAETQTDANILWRRPPVAVSDDRAAIVVDAKTVALFDLDRAVEIWHFRESIEPPTYGPPSLFHQGRNLLVLHDGRWIISLDPANGNKRWDRLISDKDLSERPESIQLGSDYFFFVTGSELKALSLTDGKTAWSHPLIGLLSGWALSLTSKHVVAYPNLARVVDPEQSAWPMVVRSRKDGALSQRLLIPAAPHEGPGRPAASDLIVKIAPKSTLVATRAGLWSLTERSP